jgi:hypothetical protein
LAGPRLHHPDGGPQLLLDRVGDLVDPLDDADAAGFEVSVTSGISRYCTDLL